MPNPRRWVSSRTDRGFQSRGLRRSDFSSPGSAFRTCDSFWRKKEESMIALDPADLKLRINEAFGGLPYPGDEQIVACDCWECGEIKSALKGRHWREVSFESL